MREEVERALKAFADKKAEFWANPTRGKCARENCIEDNPILYEASDGEMVCAHHYRQQSVRDKPYPCDRCGKDGAFRDPAHRQDEYLCHECHERSGYVPTERSMIMKVTARVGMTHSKGQRDPCELANFGTQCRGEVKPRGKKGVLCAFHNDPKKFLERKGP